MEKRKRIPKHKEHGHEEGASEADEEKDELRRAYEILMEGCEAACRCKDIMHKIGTQAAIAHVITCLERAMTMANTVEADTEQGKEITPNATCEKCGGKCYGFPPFTVLCPVCTSEASATG